MISLAALMFFQSHSKLYKFKSYENKNQRPTRLSTASRRTIQMRYERR